jgi:hypothetical protein
MTTFFKIQKANSHLHTKNFAIGRNEPNHSNFESATVNPTRTKINLSETTRKTFWPSSKAAKPVRPTCAKKIPVEEDQRIAIPFRANGKYNEIPQLLDGFRMVTNRIKIS